MFSLFVLIFVLMLIADIFVTSAVIYHLRTYSLGDWTLPRIVIPLYLALSVAVVILATIAIARLAL